MTSHRISVDFFVHTFSIPRPFLHLWLSLSCLIPSLHSRRLGREGSSKTQVKSSSASRLVGGLTTSKPALRSLVEEEEVRDNSGRFYGQPSPYRVSNGSTCELESSYEVQWVHRGPDDGCLWPVRFRYTCSGLPQSGERRVLLRAAGIRGQARFRI